MRKVFMFNMISIDGYFEGPQSDINWHVVDEDFNRFAIDQLDEVDLLLFGRVTYQLMAGYWPTSQAIGDDPDVANRMNSISKVVFSRTLQRVDWQNTRLVSSNAAEEIRRLKELPGAEIGIFGSARLCDSLAGENLIDEYRLMIAPLTLNGGTPLFKPGDGRLAFNLLRSRVFKSGNVFLVYKPAGQA